jgi:hypothetical protein
VHGEVGKDVEFTLGKSGAPGYNGIIMISDVDVLGKEMGAVDGARRRVVQEINGNEADGGLGDVERLIEDKLARFALELDGTDTSSMDG